MTMDKISSIKVAEVLSQVGPTIRAQQEQIKYLTTKVAHYEKQARVRKLASEMQEKNLNHGTSFEDTVDSLMIEDDGKLNVIEQAVEMSASQVKLAALSDYPGNPTDAHGTFEALILGE